MDQWKKEYIQNHLYELLEMVSEDPDGGEPTVESLLKKVQELVDEIKLNE